MLHIKDPEAHRLASEIAAATNTTLTDAVMTALREKSDRLKIDRKEKAAEIKRALTEFAAEWRKGMGPDLPTREELDAEIYDEFGLPK